MLYGLLIHQFSTQLVGGGRTQPGVRILVMSAGVGSTPLGVGLLLGVGGTRSAGAASP